MESQKGSLGSFTKKESRINKGLDCLESNKKLFNFFFAAMLLLKRVGYSLFYNFVFHNPSLKTVFDSYLFIILLFILYLLFYFYFERNQIKQQEQQQQQKHISQTPGQS